MTKIKISVMDLPKNVKEKHIKYIGAIEPGEFFLIYGEHILKCAIGPLNDLKEVPVTAVTDILKDIYVHVIWGMNESEFHFPCDKEKPATFNGYPIITF